MRILKRYSAQLAALLVTLCINQTANAEEILGSKTFRPEITGNVGIVAAGRHFAAEAGMRMLNRGGNAVDAGVAAVFAAAVTEISHFGLGGEVPIILYLAKMEKALVINGQGVAPKAASPDLFKRQKDIPTNGPSAGTVPAVVDALCLALAEFGTLSLSDVLEPAISLADGFVWYHFLEEVLKSQLEDIRKHPSGADAYLQGPDQSVPVNGSLFRQPALAKTLRSLVHTEQVARNQGRKAAIYAARDEFYKGHIGQRIAAAVKQAGGLLSARDLANYQGKIESPTQLDFVTERGTFTVFKTDFWGQGPVLLQTLALLQGFDLKAMQHNSTAYIHTITEALKLALADRDTFYGDPDFSPIPRRALLSAEYADERRQLIDSEQAVNYQRPGEPWSFETQTPDVSPEQSPKKVEPRLAGYTPGELLSPDTTSVNVIDNEGNLFSAAPSSAWFYGGVFIAGDTGVPLGNRMQAFVPDKSHSNQIQGSKRPRTTLSPTVVLRDGQPFLALSTPGGDAQDQQILQVLLNIIIFGMPPQEAIEAPRFETLQYRQSFGDHRLRPGILLVENRIAEDVMSDLLLDLDHEVIPVGAYMITGAIALVGKNNQLGTLFGAADVRGQRYVIGR